MKRRHILEWEDLSWFPAGIRECGTTYLVAFHRMLGTPKVIAPLLMRAMHSINTRDVVDLCSGGGGPWTFIVRRLRDEHGIAASVTLTDLFPNIGAADTIAASGEPAIRYKREPVDAGNVPRDLKGVRTMICSFHHMRPPIARKIVEDAFKARQPLCIFEVSDNSPPVWTWWMAIPVGIIMTLFLTPFVRPFTFRQFFWTYIIPICPLFIAWDGAASNARTYTASDMQELLKGLDAPDYKWEIGAISKTGYPSKMPYLLGLPS